VAEFPSSSADQQLAGFQPGTLIGGYRLEDRIGAGGMAIVFRAKDETLDRSVALKILTPALAADSDFRERFIRESRSASLVDHPNIIPVYAAGEDRGVLYLAMRYVSGGDLHSLVKREGPLAPDRAVSLLAPVASALDAAHQAGIVHRDVKPANILVDVTAGRPEHPYLSDFGLAKQEAAGAGLTSTGMLVGTAGFTAPEQISGDAPQPASDQYALGCVAFILLTGQLPFKGASPEATLWAQMSGSAPKVTALRSDLPAVDGVLARALARNPSERFPACADFIDALGRACSGTPQAAAPQAAAPQAAAPQAGMRPAGGGTAAGPGNPLPYAPSVRPSPPTPGVPSGPPVPSSAYGTYAPGYVPGPVPSPPPGVGPGHPSFPQQGAYGQQPAYGGQPTQAPSYGTRPTQPSYGTQPAYGQQPQGYGVNPYGQPGGYAQPGAYGPGGNVQGGTAGYLHGTPAGFGLALGQGFANLFTFKGRASRSAFWWYAALVGVLEFIVFIILSVAAAASNADATGVGAAVWALWLVGALLALSVQVRRLHDSGRSGFWWFIALVPFVGGIVLLVFDCMAGTPGPNKYDNFV
jgi:serine/threonine-protein kinase